MITYREYYNRMIAICSAFNKALDNVASVDITGLIGQEKILYKAGLYVSSLAMSDDTVFSKNSVGLLLQINKFVEGYFEFGLFPPEDVEDAPKYEADWRDNFNRYARMRKHVFLGQCFATEPIIDQSGHSDVHFWCSLQAEHLANYCVSHDIDRELIDMLSSNS